MKLTIRNYYVPRTLAEGCKRDAVFVAGGATVWDADGVWVADAATADAVEREPVAVVHVLVEPSRAASMTHAVAQRLARHGESTMGWSSGTAGALESLDAFRAALDALDAIVGLPRGSRMSVDARTAYGDASAAIQAVDAGLDPVDAESDADEYRGDVAGIIRDAHGLDGLADEVGGLSDADMLDHVAAGRTARETAAWYVAESDAADGRRARDYRAECEEQRAALRNLDDGRGLPGSTAGPARPATVPETLDRAEVAAVIAARLEDAIEDDAYGALMMLAEALGLADAVDAYA